MISTQTLSDASAIVYRHMPPTPQYAWPMLADEIGAEVWLKHENATPTGAFKVRGGLVFMERLARERSSVAGIVSATRGNHGQSLAYAGRTYGISVTIVVPHGNSLEKNAAMASFGAEVVVHGTDFQEALEHSVKVGEQRGLEMVPPFHPDLVAGVSTYAKEFFDAAGELDAVYVPIGMGSGINAVIAIRDLLGLRTEVIGAVSSEAPATALSHAARRPVQTTSARTFVDGVATRSPDPNSLAGMYDGASRIVQVDDNSVADAMRLIYRATHHLPEPAGAIAIAALHSERERQHGRRIGAILTGCNMDTSMAQAVLSGATPPP